MLFRVLWPKTKYYSVYRVYKRIKQLSRLLYGYANNASVKSDM
jgi:hypothetical protein